MQLLSYNDSIKLSAFILDKSGILDSLFKSFSLKENEKMTFEEQSRAMLITCNFIRNYIDDYTNKQGNSWLVGDNLIMPSDNLVIFNNIIINMSNFENHIDDLNEKLELEFNHKYNLIILL